MSVSFNKQDISVFEYLRGGTKSDDVTADSVRKYFAKLLQESSTLPFHYQLRIDELLRESELDLLSYLSGVLRGIVFYIKKDAFKIRGLEHLYKYSKGPLLTRHLQDERNIQSLIDKNFSLHPIMLDTSLNIDQEIFKDIFFIGKEYGGGHLGYLGLAGADYDLVFSVFKYLDREG
jgi:hypothetical protein